jgi:hypothetical protein
MGIIVWIAVGLAAGLRATMPLPGLMLPAVARYVPAEQMPGRRTLRSVIYSTGRRQVGHRTANR